MSEYDYLVSQLPGQVSAYDMYTAHRRLASALGSIFFASRDVGCRVQRAFWMQISRGDLDLIRPV